MTSICFSVSFTLYYILCRKLPKLSKQNPDSKLIQFCERARKAFAYEG